MWDMATLAMELSSASMKVARVTVKAMTQGLARGRQVSWKLRVAAAKPISSSVRQSAAMGCTQQPEYKTQTGEVFSAVC